MVRIKNSLKRHKPNSESIGDKTTEIIVSDSNTTTTVSVLMKYPATAGNGDYHLEILLTLSSGAVMEFDFNKIVAKDITV